MAPVTPCGAWHCGNKDECNGEEGNCYYPSHFYLTTTRNGRPQANRCQTSPSSGWLQDGTEKSSRFLRPRASPTAQTPPHTGTPPLAGSHSRPAWRRLRSGGRVGEATTSSPRSPFPSMSLEPSSRLKYNPGYANLQRFVMSRALGVVLAFFIHIVSAAPVNAEVARPETTVPTGADASCVLAAEAAEQQEIVQNLCGGRPCSQVCLPCGGNVSCVPAGTSCCGFQTCGPGRSCIPCGGQMACAELGSSCCGTLVCGPGRSCVGEGGQLVCR